MDKITKPSITRLGRRAAVKSMSDDCYNNVRNIVNVMLTDVIKKSLVVNSVHGTRTLMVDDVYDALRLMGHNVTSSSELGTTTCAK